MLCEFSWSGLPPYLMFATLGVAVAEYRVSVLFFAGFSMAVPVTESSHRNLWQPVN